MNRFAGIHSRLSFAFEANPCNWQNDVVFRGCYVTITQHRANVTVAMAPPFIAAQVCDFINEAALLQRW